MLNACGKVVGKPEVSPAGLIGDNGIQTGLEEGCPPVAQALELVGVGFHRGDPVADEGKRSGYDGSDVTTPDDANLTSQRIPPGCRDPIGTLGAALEMILRGLAERRVQASLGADAGPERLARQGQQRADHTQ